MTENTPNLRRGTILRSWSCGDFDDLALLLTDMPPWHASVYALRYGICSGRHYFYPFKSKLKLVVEASRLASFVAKPNFVTPRARREFRMPHPECANYTWDRLQIEGPPYDYVFKA